MTDLMLFDNKERIETRPSNGNENTFDYFKNTGRIDIIPVREVMENWFRIYPDSEKEEMKKRLKADFGPAFYELGMYCYFKKMGYDIFIHPTVPNSSKRPDFLAHKNDHDFYVEIKEIRMLSDAERLKERRLNTLIDSMNFNLFWFSTFPVILAFNSSIVGDFPIFRISRWMAATLRFNVSR